MMITFNVEEDMPIESKMLTKIIESSQKKVEGRNFSIRKNVLNYDDVMNSQREIIYKERAQVLAGEDMHEFILKMISDLMEETVNEYITSDDDKESWNLIGLREFFRGWITDDEDLNYTEDELDETSKEMLIEALTEKAKDKYTKKEEEVGSEVIRELERMILLRVVDTKWMAHIDDMDELKKGIGLRAYGQKNPVIEFRYEGFEMFDEMVKAIRLDTIRMLMSFKIAQRQQFVPRETTQVQGG
jgi:preprotein translocase subunit SecA